MDGQVVDGHIVGGLGGVRPAVDGGRASVEDLLDVGASKVAGKRHVEGVLDLLRLGRSVDWLHGIGLDGRAGAHVRQRVAHAKVVGPLAHSLLYRAHLGGRVAGWARMAAGCVLAERPSGGAPSAISREAASFDAASRAGSPACRLDDTPVLELGFRKMAGLCILIDAFWLPWGPRSLD